MFSRFSGRISAWINERWPLSASVRLALDEEMAGGSSYAYVFGSSALIVFLLQAATGIWQLFYYVPVLGQGYNSLNYLRTEVPFGWLIHGLHFWGASAMVVLVILHMSQVFIWGAYKRPHELQWVSGIFLFLLTMAMSLTGGALPWDKRSYWLVEVASSAAGTVPVVGDFIKRIMLGGGVIGQLTLSRFFILHAAILSGALLVLAVIHLVALRKVGNAGPWDERKRAEKGPFWPDQVFKDGLVAALVTLLLVALSAYFPPPFAGMADPLDASYIPKPEWNFLFFYQALKFFPGHLEVIATVGIPVIGTLLLFLIPFADRGAERDPRRRPAAMAGWFVAAGIFIGLTLAGAVSKPEGIEPAAGPAGAPPAPAPAGPAAGEKAGSDLFRSQGCIACHRIGGVGGEIGPDLSREGLAGRSRQWLETQLRDPKSHNPASIMPPLAGLSRGEIDQLIDYLLSLKERPDTDSPAGSGEAGPAADAPAGPRGGPGAAASIIGSGDHGAILFAATCASCHGAEGTGKVPNPGSRDGTVPSLNPVHPDEFSPDPQAFAEKLDRYIQHGSRPEGPRPSIGMPAFGDSHALTQQQIADLEAYILRLNNVDRAAIAHPGIAPKVFFPAAAAVFLLAGVPLWAWWRFGGRRRREGKETVS